MRLTLLGVRGSTAAPGADFVRYGGHTSCVAVGHGADPPGLVLDAGTGIRSLPPLLSGTPFHGDIVLTHLHWDHMQGLPFCPAIDHPDARVRLHVPVESADDDPVAIVRRGMSPPHFPIGPEGLLGSWEFVPLLPGAVKVEDERFEVSVMRIRHKGAATYGVRVSADGISAAYLPDHLLTSEADDDGATFVAGVDVLLHDGQFTSAEATLAGAYGHTTIPTAIAYADRCEVGALTLTHHSPVRTDAALEALAQEFDRTPGGRAVTFAAEGDVVDVG